jgi:hypothetical protein
MPGKEFEKNTIKQPLINDGNDEKKQPKEKVSNCSSRFFRAARTVFDFCNDSLTGVQLPHR